MNLTKIMDGVADFLFVLNDKLEELWGSKKSLEDECARLRKENEGLQRRLEYASKWADTFFCERNEVREENRRLRRTIGTADAPKV